MIMNNPNSHLLSSFSNNLNAQNKSYFLSKQHDQQSQIKKQESKLRYNKNQQDQG